MKKISLITLLFCSVCLASDPNVVELQKTIERQNQMIERLKKDLLEQKRENENLQKKYDELSKKYKSLEKTVPLKTKNDTDQDFNGLEIGKTAIVSSAKIITIVDSNNFIAKIIAETGKEWLSTGRGTGFYRNSAIYKEVWIQGISTNDKVDEQTITLNKRMKIVSTKTYDTTDGGTRTVFLLKPVE